MKIVFFGLGSIGLRYLGLLKKHYNHSLYAYKTNCRPTDLKKSSVCNIDSPKKLRFLGADIAFITNPTYLHIDTAINCAKLGMNLFIEKPMGSDKRRLNELLNIVRKKQLTSYVAYNLRFHKVVKKLKIIVENNNPVHMRVIASSYLPDWRPGRRYEETYSAYSKKGGGAVLDLSHELDYTGYILGGVHKISGTFGKISDLKVRAEDFADINAVCRYGTANIHVNYFSRNRERTVSIDFKDSVYVKADLIKNTIAKGGVFRNNTVKKYDTSIDDTYLEQLKYFFKNILAEVQRTIRNIETKIKRTLRR